ncbi:MAG: DUF362 domain-containing protein [Eubacteriaceae bacterium]|nr:DUF362 domain-containing protein [Eubacteriaceae bacterium]
MSSAVVIEKTDEPAVFENYVVLPDCFGTGEYDDRADVRAIRETVDSALEKLDAAVRFTQKLSGNREVIIKPNLVSVYHDSGFRETDYPETTDPRVFEAVVRFVSRFTQNITIAESSGKPMPTRVNFRTTGYDRIARYYGASLVALEERPVTRYMLPKAEVMKEVYLPDTFERAVRGEAFYISVPKMKTNLYTGVTLGFKNAMGTIPYFLRERNHSYLINKKLTDLMYLFRPDLTVIDAIVGGEGNTPAPVDPVKVGKIIAGNNSVETDRVATVMMGFDPDSIPLMTEADTRGFGDRDVRIIGEAEVIAFRPAVSSFLDEKTQREFPNLHALYGHTLEDSGTITDPQLVTPGDVQKLERQCTGGCLAAAKTGLDYYNFTEKPKRDFTLWIVVGSGIELDGKRWWFDSAGRAYSLEDLRKIPDRKLALGNCSRPAAEACDYFAKGCCDPAECMAAVCRAAGVRMPIMSVKNRKLPALGLGMFRTVLIRRKLIRRGMYVDCPYSQEDRIFPIPEDAGRDADYIPWPLPEMSRDEKRRMLRDQWRILSSALLGGRK